MLVLAALFGFLVRDFVREVIVQPFLYVIWFITLFLRSLPQFFFWIVFVLLALFVAARSLRGRKQVAQKVYREPAQLGGPVAVWARLIHHAERGGYSRWQLAQSLAKLTWDIFGDGERLTAQQIDARIKAGQLKLPPEIQAYFAASMTPYQPTSRFRRFLLGKGSATPLDLNPEQVVAHLEDKLNPLRGDSS